MNNLDLPERTKLFINENLCLYYNELCIICKKIVEREANTFIFCCLWYKFRFEEHGPVKVVTHSTVCNFQSMKSSVELNSLL